MPGTPTPILGLTVPLVGGDANAWGSELNANFAVLDSLGVTLVVNQSSSFPAAPNPVGPEVIYRVTLGGLAIVATLPDPSLCLGKKFTFIVVDATGGSLTIAGTIDGNAGGYVRANQWSFVSVVSNGSGFEVVGVN